MNAGALDWSSVPIVTRKWPVRGEARGLETHRGGGSGGGDDDDDDDDGLVIQVKR